jgi:hypothetical protein
MALKACLQRYAVQPAPGSWAVVYGGDSSMFLRAASGVPWWVVMRGGGGHLHGGAWRLALARGQPAAHPVVTCCGLGLGCVLESELAVGLTAPARVCLGWVRPSAAACSEQQSASSTAQTQGTPLCGQGPSDGVQGYAA